MDQNLYLGSQMAAQFGLRGLGAASGADKIELYLIWDAKYMLQIFVTHIAIWIYSWHQDAVCNNNKLFPKCVKEIYVFLFRVNDTIT